MKKRYLKALFLAVIIATTLSFIPSKQLTYENSNVVTFEEHQLGEMLELKAKNSEIKSGVGEYLKSKKSPLASHLDTLLEQEHWKLLIAISAIESSYCKRQIGNNCWGITDSSGAYKSYESFDEAIIDANGLITRWQARGRWLTIQDFNCHYVVPCNENWVNVVTQVHSELEKIENEQRDKQLSQP